MYQFNFKITEKDYLEFNRYHWLHSKTGKRSRLLTRWIITALYLVLGIAFLIPDANGYWNPISGSIFIILAVLWFIFIPKINMASSMRNVKKILKEGKSPLNVPTTITFTENEVHDVSTRGESKIPYKEIDKLCIGKDIFYLYINSMQALLLPFSAFENEEQKESFLRFMEEKISKEKMFL